MNETIILAAVSVAIFFVLPLAIKSNAIYAFLLLGISEIISGLVAKDATKFTSSFIANPDVPLFTIIQISILALPALFILLIYRKSLKPKFLLLNIICGLSAAFLFFYLAASKLPYETKTVIENTELFHTVTTFLDVALVAGLLSSVIYLVLKKPKREKEDKKHK